MQRRRLVALVAVIVFVLLGIVGVSTLLFLTRTERGRGQLRSIAQYYAKKLPGGSVYVGNVTAISFTEITIDSVAIRDKRGELFLSTGRLTFGFDPRDLADLRIYIRRASVQHPYLHMVQHENGVWNFKEIFSSPNPEAPTPKDTKRRNLGDYIVIDSARVIDATYLLTLAWHPDEKLRGAARDSAIRVHLDSAQKAVARTFDGFGRTYAWRNARGLLVHARLADPDSDKAFGRQFRVEGLAADEYEPTFKFRNVAADVRNLGDSIWFQVPHFNMPASTGTGTGKVWWGSNLPVRYDIAIHGDSVSLDDVNWVYPTLPRTGGGTLNLLIKNDPKDLQIVDFKLVKMDVRSTKSHLTGDMSFGTGAPLLLVRNVDLRAEPIDFDLIRTLAGKPLAVDWQGQITGTVKGRGGPLTHFVVDDARGTFRDAHVKGAVSDFTGHGELDILVPAQTVFHSFDVNVGSLDLRSIEYLYPAFPQLGGFVSGTATLDSSYLDVRFSNADVTHRDGPGEPSHFTGHGRVTDAGALMVYDVALEAQPLSLTMLSRSYPKLGLSGLVSGPITAKGSSPDLELSLSLQNASAAVSFDGRLDIDTIGGMGANGRGQFSTANLGALLKTRKALDGRLGLHYDVDVSGYDAHTWASLGGSASFALERTVLDSVRVYPARIGVRFADGEMKIDSARVHTDAVTVQLSGGLALPKIQPSDSITFSVTADSLGGLRSYLPPPDTTLLGAAKTPLDSLSGRGELTGFATGTLDELNLRGQLAGKDLYYKKERADSAALNFDLRNVLANRSGIFDGSVDGVTLAGIAFDSISAKAVLDDSTHAHFSGGALSRNGLVATTAGDWTKTGTLNTVRFASFGMNIGDARWTLAAPTRIAFDSAGTRFDSLTLRNRDSATIVFAANVPDSGSASATFRATHVPLRDVGTLAQFADTLNGIGNLTATIGGTRLKPTLVANADLSSLHWYRVNIDQASIPVRFSDGRLGFGLDVTLKGRRAITVTGNIPADITLFGFKQRDDSVSGKLAADSADLAIASAMLPPSAKTTLSGWLTGRVTASGTWRAPVFVGQLAIKQGYAKVDALGVTITDIDGVIEGVRSLNGQDSILVSVGALGAKSGGSSGGSLSFSGYVKNLFQTKGQQSFSFALSANSFHAFNKRTLAELYVSTPDTTARIRLTGSTQTPRLSGSLLVDRGSIFLPDREIARKLAVETLAADTAEQVRPTAGAAMFSTLMTNLNSDVTITLGDVRLRSAEANVGLGGQLRLTTQTTRVVKGQLLPEFSLEGTLATTGGTYNLNLGLAQREFQVLPDGTVTFDGPPKNPLLDIRARYNVRRSGDRDLGINVNLIGPLLPYPGITFSSDAGYDIAQSDLVSYLLTGNPGFDFGQNQAASQVVASFLAPTISAFAADRLRQSLGSAFDMIQFQLGTSNTTPGANENSANTLGLGGYLSGATIGAEKQFRNIFLNVNTGFCQFSSTSTQSFNALSGVGAKAEYRIQPDLSFKLSYDPATSGRVCAGQQQGITGFVQTPWQLGLSLAHTIRF